ncbi:MAG: SDR family oxidoreductase, partial [Ilumatobacteraceae bacterium]
MTQQVVLITGAAGGIGGATRQRFLAGGWRVAAVDVKPMADEDGVRAIHADLLDVDQCRAAVEQAVAWAGRLDAVVNAAGLWTEGPSAESTEEEWDRVLGVNLKALYFVTTAAIVHLAATDGCVVNLSS